VIPTKLRTGLKFRQAFQFEIEIEARNSFVSLRLLLALYVGEINVRFMAHAHPRSASEKGALSHFTQIFEKEMDQKTIQHMYEYYTKRLHDCRRAEAQMTKY
jgi:hypothetical protein